MEKTERTQKTPKTYKVLLVLRKVAGIFSGSSMSSMSSLNVPAGEFFDGSNKEAHWKPLPKHTLEQSPCYPVIGVRKNTGFYYCKLHPEIENANLDSIEHHCRYVNPGRHEIEVRSPLKEGEVGSS